MIKNIIVPLDGSLVGAAALPYAEALAERVGARLTLVRAAHVQRPTADGVDQQRAVAEAEDYLAALAEQLRARGFEVETGIPFGGSAARWILEEIDLRRADLVVMATHDRVGPDRWIHGSIAEVVVGHASVPVLLVCPTHGAHLAQPFTSERPVLIVPLDGSELAEAALPLASEFAATFGGRIVLVGVMPGPDDLVAAQGGVMTYAGDDYEVMLADARVYLDGIGTRLTGVGFTASTVVRSGNPAQQIAAVASDQGAAIVVMATHGRTGIVRSMLGSVAGETLHHSPCPVLLIHPATLHPIEVPVSNQVVAVPAGA
jgi:nucleotide-binding universal stress UspA family protein